MTAPPTLPRLRLATTRLASGPRLHYVEQGDPSGAGLVFIHGWPDSWYSWSRVLPLLAPARCHAYAFDQRGFGDSERPADRYTLDDFAADVVAFLDAVGLAEATLVGHSFGSFVARRVAETRPERVAGLVLIGSAATPVNEVTREVQQIAQSLEDPLPVEFVREFQASTLHLPVPEPFFERLVAESLKAPARVWRSAFDNLLASDDADQLGRVAAPTLIIWGEHDGLFPREEQPLLAAAIPQARLTVYPETGHSPNWERPERVAADLEAFLDARLRV
jgi:pimeloyl-ACP methyl ester carboxylesterase